MSIIFSGCSFPSLPIARVVKSLALDGPKSFLSTEGRKGGRVQVSMEGRHPTLSHRVKSSDVRLRSSSGEEACLENWARSVSSWNLCAKEAGKKVCKSRGFHRIYRSTALINVFVHKLHLKHLSKHSFDLKLILTVKQNKTLVIRFIWKENPTSVFMFLFIILSSVCFRSRINEWFRCSSQRFLRSTCHESWRTTAAGKTQHCRENVGEQINPKVRFQCAKNRWHDTTITTSVALLQTR